MVAWHLRPTVARALQFRGPFALLTVPFTRRAVRHLLRHIEEVADINAVVVKHFATNKATLVELFRTRAAVGAANVTGIGHVYV